MTSQVAPAALGSLARPAWRWYAAWVLAGAALVLGVASVLSIGMLVLPVALAANVLLARRPAASAGLPGFVSGLGLPLLLFAFVNRRGPGLVCTTSNVSQSCSERHDPRAWLLAGLLLVLLGFFAFVRRQRSTT